MIYKFLLYLHKLTLQVKAQLIIIFVLFSFLAVAQEQADYSVYIKNDKVYLEAKILIEDVATIVQSEDYCEAGTSMSFCLRNYLAEKLEITLDGGAPLAFIIEASLANSTKLQVNLSSDDSVGTITQMDITNNAFVDDMTEFKNVMKVSLNGNTTVVTLDKLNRSASFN